MKPGQFSLRDLFFVTAFVGIACAELRYAGRIDVATINLACMLAAPIVTAGLVGALLGRLRLCLVYAIAVDAVLMLLLVMASFVIP